MAPKEIVWSKLAKLQLANILEFYLQRNGSPKYSLKILLEVQALLAVLSKNELMGRLTSNKFTRVIPLKAYLIFYEINGKSIEIVSFWDNRQDITSRKVK